MPMRLSGLASGMDTEAIVEQLMKAHRLKATKIENKITTTEWKQEKWKELNSKIYSFYTNQLSKMRLQSTFMTKKAVSSNENKVSVTAGTNAPEGTHRIKIEQLASAQYVTGAKIEKSNVSLDTKLSDLGFDLSKGITIEINTGDGKTKKLEVKSDTTLGDFVNTLKSAGLNASFDTTHNRLFISSKSSGKDYGFTITTSSSTSVKNKNVIREFLGYDSFTSAEKNRIDNYLDQYLNDNLTADDRSKIKESILEVKKENYISEYMSNADYVHEIEKELRNEIESEGKNLSDEEFSSEVLKRLKDKAEEENEATLDNFLSNYLSGGNTSTVDSSLVRLGLDNITFDADGKAVVGEDSEVSLISASDAIVKYNDAEFTSSSNNLTINGLTLNLKDETAPDEEIKITVSGNTEAVYNTIKDFIKTYNELLSELNKAYNADSARGFDPLTDEQKASMTEEQIKKWEDKIKDALLRRDDTVGSLINMFRSTLNENVEVNGKKYALSSFGIASQNYSEKGILHISGDADDMAVALSDNKLMEALTNDPDTVAAVFNELASKLYSSLMDRMKSTTLSSALTVYNDKELDKTLTNYKSDLKKMEAKLTDLENRYYKQFAAMESALSSLNSQSSYLSSLFGSNKQ